MGPPVYPCVSQMANRAPDPGPPYFRNCENVGGTREETIRVCPGDTQGN
jgi:hypothetical protein